MCRALYIASNNPLPLIGWDEGNPGFCVLELQEHEENVREQFALPYVVYAGSFEGCSCGFVYDEEPVDNDEFEIQHDSQARESVKKLAEYVSGLLDHGAVELFTCWEGEQNLQPEERVVIGRNFFQRSEFGFEGVRHFTLID